jgi:hypothetical protein
LTLGSSQFIEGGSGEMVLRDEKERIRLARLSSSIRKETKCCIYRSKLQTFEGEPEIDDVDVYLGLTSCSRVEACGICLDSECLDRFEEYLTHDEQVEFKHCLISSDSRTFEKYQVEVAKMIREREDMAQRKIEKEIAESKRLEEERRKKEEEEEAELQRLELEAQLKQEEEEKKRVEQQRERLAVLKLEQKEKISQQQREFTNKELLEIVNDTEEGRAILEREKLRIQAEMEKVESMETVPELQRIGLRVELFAKLKRPQEMRRVEVTLSIADSDGKILESHDCCEIETTTEDIAYKIFGAEVSFALKIGEIPEKSAFIIELKHFKEKSKKVSTKCWSYIDTRAVFEKITIENNAGRGGLWQVLLPLAAKPTDPSRKMWNNYDETFGLFSEILTIRQQIHFLVAGRNTSGVLALFNLM